MGTPGKRWWWISYTDETMPKGERACGACVVQVGGGFSHAALYALESGLQPTGNNVEALGGMVDVALGDPPPSYVNRYLTNSEAAELARLWGGGVASQDDIKAAFSDDSARVGDPLFKGSR